jgi:prepilin-type N-terminal cleavage/methylation domain-containing protein
MLIASRKSHHSMSRRGFTIVELLIVIIVIAILAAITVVAYNGVRQRANNATVVDAAGKSMRMVASYIAATGAYPATAQGCITSTSGCMVASAIAANSTFDTNIATVGTVPRSIPLPAGGTRYGLVYGYSATRQVNSVVQPVFLYFWLTGINQQCGMQVAATWGDTTANTAPSSTGYSVGNDYGATLCIVNVPGP